MKNKWIQNYAYMCLEAIFNLVRVFGHECDEMLKLQPLQCTQLSAKVNKCRLCIDRYSSACLKRKYYYLTPKGRCPFVTMNNARAISIDLKNKTKISMPYI